MEGQDSQGTEFFLKLQKEEVKVEPCDSSTAFSDESRFKKLELTREQKMQVSEMLQHIPEIFATREIAKAYKVSFPNGLPHTLMALKRGGYASAIMENGQIVGMASFTPMLGQAVLYGVFTVMPISTGQFFLSKINKELKEMNSKLDDILQFLYGDKRAELLAEVSFVRYASENYCSLMANDIRRTATLINIQEARKVAMKDIVFYLDDLKSKTDKAKKELLFSQTGYENLEIYYLVDITIDGVPARVQCFVFDFTDSESSFSGRFIDVIYTYVYNNSFYVIRCAAFEKLYDKYGFIFDNIMETYTVS